MQVCKWHLHLFLVLHHMKLQYYLIVKKKTILSASYAGDFGLAKTLKEDDLASSVWSPFLLFSFPICFYLKIVCHPKYFFLFIEKILSYWSLYRTSVKTLTMTFVMNHEYISHTIYIGITFYFTAELEILNLISLLALDEVFGPKFQLENLVEESKF